MRAGLAAFVGLLALAAVIMSAIAVTRDDSAEAVAKGAPAVASPSAASAGSA